MNALNAVSGGEFKIWMTVTLSLLKDGKMGASKARADRIRTAVFHTHRTGEFYQSARRPGHAAQ